VTLRRTAGVVLIATALTSSIAIAPAAVAAQRAPLEAPVGTVPGTTHEVRFAYEADLRESPAYPDGSVGPVEAPADAVPTPLDGSGDPSNPATNADAGSPTLVPSPQVIVAAQLEQLTLTIETVTEGDGAADATFGVERVLTSDLGWTERTTVVEAAPLVDDTGRAAVDVGIDDARERLTQVAEALGTDFATFELTYESIVTLPDGEEFVAPFRFGVGDLVAPDSAIIRSDTSNAGADPQMVAQSTRLLGRTMDVATARTTTRAAILGALLALLAGAAVLRSDPRTRRQTSAAANAARIVEVDDLPAALQVITVDGLSALARLAKQEQRVILRRPGAAGTDLFAVADGDVLYVTAQPYAGTSDGPDRAPRKAEDTDAQTKSSELLR
jgi:hypothetical protein